MGEKHRTPGHHASAIYHHGQASHYHREASKHYQIGKDYAHAAHMALVAHGHALKAQWHGNEALKCYADIGVPGPETSNPAFADPLGTTRTTSLNAAEHHTAAADDNEEAVRHHGLAAQHHDGKDHTKAAYEASIAHGYARHAVFLGDEAAQHHVEHYGKSGPTAEIL